MHARCIPSAVSRILSGWTLSMAPIFDKLRDAASTNVFAGGSNRVCKKSPFPVSTPRESNESNVWSSAHRVISGAVCS